MIRKGIVNIPERRSPEALFLEKSLLPKSWKKPKPLKKRVAQQYAGLHEMDFQASYRPSALFLEKQKYWKNLIHKFVF